MSKCYDAADRIELLTGETRSFLIGWDDYLKPAEFLGSLASVTIEEAGGPSVVASLVRVGKRSVRVKLSAGSTAGDYSLAILANVDERGEASTQPKVRVLVRVKDPAPAGDKLEMRLGDTKQFVIPFTNLMAAGEKVAGVTSVTMDRAGGGTISGEAFSNDGQRVAFTVTNPTVREDYQITAVVSIINLEGTVDTTKAVVLLHVC